MVLSFCDFLAGWGAGICGLLVGHPADTIKVRQQTRGKGGILKILYTSLQREGIQSLYKGMSFPLLSAGMQNAIFFGVYGNTLRILQEYHSEDQNEKTDNEKDKANKVRYSDIYLAGCAGGFLQCFTGCPVDLMKVKLQAESGNGQRIRVTEAMKAIYKHFGWKGFYQGFHCMLWRDIPSYGIYVLAYEHFLFYGREATDQGSNPSIANQIFAGGLADVIASGVYTLLYAACLQVTSCPKDVSTIMVAGGMAGMISWIAIIPLDVIKSRMQADDLRKPTYKGIIDCVLKSYHTDGLLVFGRGFCMIALRAFPVNAATFVGYEWCLQACQGLV